MGRKYAKLKIPDIIRSDKKCVISFIQGLADTDFSISLKRRHKKYGYYPVIAGSSRSSSFIREVSEVLANLDLKGNTYLNYAVHDDRIGKETIISRVELNGNKKLLKWMELIGFKSSKHLEKFEKWKKLNPKYKDIF